MNEVFFNIIVDGTLMLAFVLVMLLGIRAILDLADDIDKMVSRRRKRK